MQFSFAGDLARTGEYTNRFGAHFSVTARKRITGNAIAKEYPYWYLFYQSIITRFYQVSLGVIMVIFSPQIVNFSCYLLSLCVIMYVVLVVTTNTTHKKTRVINFNGNNLFSVLNRQGMSFSSLLDDNS